MIKLRHPNICNIIMPAREGTYHKANGNHRSVLYSVIELAGKGDLFNVLAHVGMVSEDMARYYFR